MVDVSVVIPAYNAAGTLPAQLQALADQVVPFTWEVILVDNGSTDGTVPVTEAYVGAIPNLQVVTARDQRGPAYARNIGAQHARGNKLLFCDADDIVADGWLLHLASRLDTYDAVGGALDNESLNEPDTIAIRRPLVADELPIVMGWKRAVTSNCGVRANVFQALSGFDTKFDQSEDTEFFLRLQMAGYQLGFVPEAKVIYRHKPGIKSNLQQVYRWGRTRPRLYRHFRPHVRRSFGVRSVGGLVLRLWWLAADRRRRLRWLGDAARFAGRVVGSVRCRTWYL